MSLDDVLQIAACIVLLVALPATVRLLDRPYMSLTVVGRLVEGQREFRVFLRNRRAETTRIHFDLLFEPRVRAGSSPATWSPEPIALTGPERDPPSLKVLDPLRLRLRASEMRAASIWTVIIRLPENAELDVELRDRGEAGNEEVLGAKRVRSSGETPVVAHYGQPKAAASVFSIAVAVASGAFTYALLSPDDSARVEYALVVVFASALFGRIAFHLSAHSDAISAPGFVGRDIDLSHSSSIVRLTSRPETSTVTPEAGTAGGG